MNISSLNWDLEQYFCLGDFGLLLNRLVAMIRSSIFPPRWPHWQPSERPTHGLTWAGLGILSSYGSNQPCPGEQCVVGHSVASVPSPPFPFCLSVSLPLFFPHPLLFLPFLPFGRSTFISSFGDFRCHCRKCLSASQAAAEPCGFDKPHLIGRKPGGLGRTETATKLLLSGII